MYKTTVVLCTLLLCSTALAQLAGIKTVGVGGDFATLTAALSTWKSSTITGDVTFQLLDTIYPSETYPLRCTIPAGYSGGDWNLVIKPVSGIRAKFEGSNATSIFDLNGIDRLTIDSLIIVNLNLGTDTAGHAVRFINGASFNVVRNCELRAACKLISSLAGGVVYFATAESPSGPGNNNNLVVNCLVTTSQPDRFPVYAITIRGSSPMYTRTNNNNTIKGCKICDFSSIGVYFSAYDSNTTITENDFYSTTPQNTTSMTGIRISATSVCNTKITQNKFYDFMAGSACVLIQAIFISMATAASPPLIANNFIALDGNFTNPNADIYGIRLLRQETTTGTYMFYYNSIYIGGTPTTKSSFGFFCKPTASLQTKIDFRNNIVFNNRSGGTGKHYCIFDSLASSSSFASDYNDLYVSTPGSNGQYVAYRAGVDLTTLANWQNATARDSHSISLNPDFVSATNLHISPTSSSVNDLGTPIGLVTFDIDGEARSDTTPDIGADEYTPGNVHMINASAIGPGTITPSGMVVINHGADTTFVFTPNANCQLDSLIVDNVNYGGAITYYRFINVITDHTITVYFSPIIGFSVLLIPDWNTDSIYKFDPYNGAPLGGLFKIPGSGSPKNAIPGPDGKIYVSDQVQDAVFMFDTLGTYLGIYADASDGLDNIRGIAFRGDHLFVCCYHGTSSLRAVKEFSAPHTYVRDFIVNYTGIDPFDILFLPDGRCLFADAGTSDKIALHDTNGVYIRTVYGRANLWPQQIQNDPQLPGAFLACLWDADSIIDFELNGTIIAACTLTYVKGVYRLGNGNILATNNYGMYEINMATGAVTRLNTNTGWQYIERYTAPPLGIVEQPTYQPYLISIDNIHPNPFRAQTAIRYSLNSKGKVSLAIYDIAGKLVRNLIDQYQSPGSYSINWNGKDNRGLKVPNGVYICNLKAGNKIAHRQVILIK